MKRRRFFGIPVTVTDWAVAVSVSGLLLAGGLSGQRPNTDLGVLGYVLLVAGGLALAAHRRAPILVLVLTGLCAVGYQAIGFDVLAVAYLVAVYAAVRAGHHIVTVSVSVVMLVTLYLMTLVWPLAGSEDGSFIQGRGVLELGWLIAAGAAGEALRQAERRADEAERSREATAQQRANEERLHIARELHDSLTHQISVVKVQAEVAVHLAQRQGERASEGLLAIREAGREAARDLRATLEALRDDDSALQGLDHVPELVERARTNGLDATLTVEGQRPDVPTAVDRTAFRIVQEALTNTARHAAAASAWVRIAYRPGSLAIQVDDDGLATPADAPIHGLGLLGMRERVTALGGQLRAEPRSAGGFSVHAELPVDGAS